MVVLVGGVHMCVRQVVVATRYNLVNLIAQMVLCTREKCTTTYDDNKIP